MNEILFYFFALLAVGSGIAMITRRNLVHAAIFLAASALATAGVFLQLGAEFLFIVQIFLFVGGTVTLFLFVIPFFNSATTESETPMGRPKRLVIGLTTVFAALAVFAMIAGRASLRLPALASSVPTKSTEAFGDVLFQQYLVPFEITSILLLVAMIGVVTMAKGKT